MLSKTLMCFSCYYIFSLLTTYFSNIDIVKIKGFS